MIKVMMKRQTWIQFHVETTTKTLVLLFGFWFIIKKRI